MKLFADADERKQAVVLAAAVAAHALLCNSREPRAPAKDVAKLAFIFGEAFVAEAEQRQ